VQAAQVRTDREKLARALAELPGVTPFPSAANFILSRVPDAPRLGEHLRRNRILIRPLHDGHPLLEHTLRVTVGTEAENAAFLTALKRGLAALDGAAAANRVG